VQIGAWSRAGRARARWELAPDPSLPALLRAESRSHLTAWAIPPAVIADTVLVLTELTTNAVEHAGTRIRVQLTFTGTTVRIRVRDWSPHPPRAQPHPLGTSRGHGLRLVDAVATRWGWRTHTDGKTVWAALTTGPHPGEPTIRSLNPDP
jgi:anti-sigma regulatory factor (Ser/Thr protein kinase)